MAEAGLRAAFLRRKPIDDIESEGGDGLQRTLGLWQLTAIGSAASSAPASSPWPARSRTRRPGPAVLVSFLIAGVASAAAALSYAEFAGLIPKAGSAYTYGYVVLGEFAGWFIGWDLLLEYTAIVAVVAIGISGYFGDLSVSSGCRCRRGCWARPARPARAGHLKVDLFAVLLCLLIAFLLNRGMRSAARFETWLVVPQGRDGPAGDRRRRLPHPDGQLRPVLPVRARRARSPAPRRSSSPCSATTR